MQPLDKAKASKTFCIYPWTHQYVGPPGDVKPCCVYLQDQELGSLKQNTLKEIWNNDNTKKMRVDMLNGKVPSGCDICFNRESIVDKTHRDNANESLFKQDVYDLINLTQEDGYLPEHKLLYLDARWNNLCNLKCRTCGPRFSTSWIDDHAKLFNKSIDDIKKSGDTYQFSGKTENQLFDEILPHIPYLKQIYFAGGEPLMQEDHYKVLQELIRIGHTGFDRQLIINYNTNFTQLKLGKHNALEYWKQFKELKINASIDGSYKKAEYWRKGSNWETIVNNRRRLLVECPNVKFNISYTVSWISVYNLFDLHKEWVQKKFIDINDININLLEVATYFSIKNIPHWKKLKIEKELDKHLLWLIEHNARPDIINQFNNIKTFMYSIDTTQDDFMFDTQFFTINNKLDELRNENFWDIYPEHEDMKVCLNV